MLFPELFRTDFLFWFHLRIFSWIFSHFKGADETATPFNGDRQPHSWADHGVWKAEYDCHTVGNGQSKVNIQHFQFDSFNGKNWPHTKIMKTEVGLDWILWRNKSDRLHEKGRKKRAKKKQPKVSEINSIYGNYGRSTEIEDNSQWLQLRSTSTLPVGIVSPKKVLTERMKRVALRWKFLFFFLVFSI